MAITIPNTFVAGTKIEASPMNANFAETANAVDKRGDTVTGNIAANAGVKFDGVDLSTIPNSSGTFDPLFAQVVIGTADTNGIRLDLETGTLAVREGDDSAYAPLISGLLTTSGNHVPAANDGGTLGTGTASWSDLFLASGGVVNFNNGDVTITHSANALAFGGASTGYTFDALVSPASNDGAALGSGTVSWADLFLASGGVINFNNGDVTVTHSTNKLTFAGATSDYIFNDGNVQLNAGTLRIKNSVSHVSFVRAEENATTAAYTYLTMDGRSTGYLSVSTNDTERMRLTSDGNLGINSTAPPLKLSVLSGVATNNTATKLIMLGSDRNDYYASIDSVRGGDSTRLGLAFSTADGGSVTERMRITSAGHVQPGANDGGQLGVSGTAWSDLFLASGGVINFNAGNVTLTHSNNTLEMKNTATTTRLNVYSENNSGAPKFAVMNGLNSCAIGLLGDSSGTMVLFAGDSTSERARITGGGYFKASNNGVYVSATSSEHEIRQTANGENTLKVYSAASSGSQYGIGVITANDQNDATRYFLSCGGGSTTRAVIYTNGGLANYSANNVNLSDARIKTDVQPAPSYWDKFKAIEIVTFKYTDQTHDDDNIGVIAQQVEAVAPEFVDVDGFGETPADGVPLKTIYTTDLYHAAIKALQEAMSRIETLESRVAALEA